MIHTYVYFCNLWPLNWSMIYACFLDNYAHRWKRKYSASNLAKSFIFLLSFAEVVFLVKSWGMGAFILKFLVYDFLKLSIQMSVFLQILRNCSLWVVHLTRINTFSKSSSRRNKTGPFFWLLPVWTLMSIDVKERF